jgi:hypothetical protein
MNTIKTPYMRPVQTLAALCFCFLAACSQKPATSKKVMKSIPLFIIYLLLNFSILSSCSKLTELPTDGLILHYPFDKNAEDASGNNNDAINYTLDKYVKGKRGKALDFNGTTDYLRVTRNINSRDGLSFSFWIRTRGTAGTENNGVIAGKYNMQTHLRCFLIYSFGSGTARSDNRLSGAFYKYGYSALIHDNVKSYMEPAELTIYPSEPSLWTILNPVKLVKGSWTHCVINVTETHLEAWINGVLCVKKQREYDQYFDSQDEPVYIGNVPQCGEGSNNHFNGIIDELRIYNRGLTSEEIEIIFRET